MRFVLVLLLGALHVISASQTQRDDAQAKYQSDLDLYFKGIYEAAVGELNIVYAALPGDRGQRLARSAIRIEVRSGADRLCFNDGRFRVAASTKSAAGAATIVLCEPDLAHLADAMIVWQLALASQADRVAQLKLLPKQSLPAEIDRAIKDRARRGIEYLIAANRAKKQDLADAGRTTRSTCLGWQVASRVESTSGPIQCSRREFDAAADAAAAAAALRGMAKAAMTVVRMADPSSKFEAPDLAAGVNSLDAIHQFRWFAFRTAIHYAIAYEIGHLTSNDPNLRSREAEQDADGIAVSTLGDSVLSANLLVFMSVALEVIWEMAGDVQHLDRTNSLHSVLFCKDANRLSGPHASQFVAGAVRLSASLCR